jgi:uncharacterized protein
MNKRKSVTVAVSAVVMLLAAVLMVARPGIVPTMARAQDDTAQGTITVVGQGKVKIKPDMAQATVGVDVTKFSVKEASAEASRIMDAVLKALKGLGVVEKDMQTSGFSVYSDRPYKPDGTQGEAVYHVSNQVNVTIRDLEKVGEILDASMAAGANNIYGVSFGLSDYTKVEAEARQKAVENARAKAEDLARLTNLQLGDVLSVSEVIGGGAGGYYPGGVDKAAIGVGGGGPVVPGELQITLQLQVIYGTVQ